MLDLSVILPLRNAEASVVAMVRGAADLVRTMGGVGGITDPPEFEVLAVDQHSGDNTLALVTLLHGKIPELRTLQDVESGTAVARAASVVKGARWVLLDRPPDRELLRWALTEVLCGHRAALVPGEVLVVERGLGHRALGRLNGGLVSAQQAVTQTLAHEGDMPAVAPGPDRGRWHHATLRVRGLLGDLGLGRLDRPPKGTL